MARTAKEVMEGHDASGDACTWTFLEPPEPERTMWPTIDCARRRLSGALKFAR